MLIKGTSINLYFVFLPLYSGLLSAHVLSDVLKSKHNKLNWYNGELLDMAKDLGYRLLPAFNTTTGIPYGRVSVIFYTVYLNIICFLVSIMANG